MQVQLDMLCTALSGIEGVIAQKRRGSSHKHPAWRSVVYLFVTVRRGEDHEPYRVDLFVNHSEAGTCAPKNGFRIVALSRNRQGVPSSRIAGARKRGQFVFIPRESISRPFETAEELLNAFTEIARSGEGALPASEDAICMRLLYTPINGWSESDSNPNSLNAHPGPAFYSLNLDQSA